MMNESNQGPSDQHPTVACQELEVALRRAVGRLVAAEVAHLLNSGHPLQRPSWLKGKVKRRLMEELAHDPLLAAYVRRA